MSIERKGVGKADQAELSLSQAILSPLDSIFQAQVHAARSFINLLLQVGYPHLVIDKNTGRPSTDPAVNPPEKYKPYELEFNFDQENNGVSNSYKVKIPALSLVPLNSLAIDSAEFNFGLKVKNIERFPQMQRSEVSTLSNEASGAGDDDPRLNRKWFLVDEPVSFKGTISSKPSAAMAEQTSEAVIDINIKLSKSPVPAALDNLLAVLTKSVSVEPINPPKTE